MKTTDLEKIMEFEDSDIIMLDTMKKPKLMGITDFLALQNMVPYGSISHNGYYRGKNLGLEYSIDDICSMIADGSFKDIFIGDYFDITIKGAETLEENVRCVVAHLNFYKGTGNLRDSCPYNHAVIVPKNSFVTLYNMNGSGYSESNMYKQILPMYAESLKEVFDTHLLTHHIYVTTRIDSSYTSNAGNGLTGIGCGRDGKQDNLLKLMDECNVYGANVCSGGVNDNEVMFKQFKIFEYNPSFRIDNDRYYWLSNIACTNNFCCVSPNGEATFAPQRQNNTDVGKLGVRPFFLIG